MDDRGVRFLAEARDFSFLHSVQSGFGIHPASSPLGTGVVSPAVRREGRPSHAEVKNGGVIPPLGTRLHGVVTN
jgi:hypothetical protein